MEIKGQTALITGAASGMGAETAHYLHSMGCQVILVDINQQGVEKVAKELGGTPVVCDVTSAENVEKMLTKVFQDHPEVRVAVNCAGICPAKRVVSRDGAMALDAFSQVINVNLIGTFNMLRIMAEHMTKLTPLADGERGVIINTASVAAFEGQIGQAAYSASKGGVAAMTLPIARELANFGVRIMAIAPGLIATPMLLNMPDEIQQSLAEQVPFPKRLGHPGEFAMLVEHIVRNTLLNGEVIRLDGAIRMQAK